MKLKKIISILAVLVLVVAAFSCNNTTGTQEIKDGAIPYSQEEMVSPATVTSSGFVSNFTNWTWYYTSDFTQVQYGNNCGPTMVANILSYFDTGRNVDLFSGTITQSLYNQICADCSYTGASGINLDTAATAIETFATRAGKTADIDEYWLNLWSDVTRDIDANKPIIMAYNSPSLNHAYIVLGYKVEDGIKYLYVFSNWASSPFQWLEYNQSYMDMQSVNIY